MSRTAGELAEYLGIGLVGNPNAEISGVASPERAGEKDLIYLESARHQERAAASWARCVIAPPLIPLAEKTILETGEPKLAFAKAAEWLLRPTPAPGLIDSTAVVAASAKLAADVVVGPYVVIEDEVEIGPRTRIEAFCFLGRGSRVGQGCLLHPRVTLYAGARLGNRVELHSGVVIGGDGFGYVFAEGRHWKFPQVGDIEIGDDVEIGANTTLDRGSLDTTRIGNGVKIDNLVQIAHNVQIGEHSILASQVGISGSSRLGKRIFVGGQAGMGEHCRIEDGAVIGGQAGVLPHKIVREGQIVWGTPARPLDKFKEQSAWLARLPELGERIRRVSQEGANEDESSK